MKTKFQNVMMNAESHLCASSSLEILVDMVELPKEGGALWGEEAQLGCDVVDLVSQWGHLPQGSLKFG